MILQPKTLQKLRELINEETEYRGGPKLVAFFNQLGFKDVYQTGFPSRWKYTDDNLAKINGTPELDKCIKQVFAPINFVGRFSKLDTLISSLNDFMAFDGWKVVRNGQEITFAKAGAIDFSDTKEIKSDDDFLTHEFQDVALDKLGLAGPLIDILNERLEEIKKCLAAKSPLSVIFLSGSSLEGILLGVALSRPKDFNIANSALKDKYGTVRPFQDWSLANFIDVAHELRLIKEDVKKFSHSLRDFRNYIHPYEQMSKQFSPDEHTAKISWQVLKAAIFQLSKNN